jgi:1-acyl-sn-glycerol-3-phosphate acyltransferase
MPATVENPFGVSSFMHNVAKLLFRLTGWVAEGSVHQPPRFVIIAAPHTSNWDAFIMLTAAYIFRVKLRWFIKEAAFFFPLGMILRRVGAIPIDRSARKNVVAQAVEQFQQNEHLILAVPPEATRKHSTSWKTGFYHIARGAGVPIVLGFIDYRRKAAGLGPAFMPTGDIVADFKEFAKFYENITPRYPGQRGVVAVDPAVLTRDSAA